MTNNQTNACAFDGNAYGSRTFAERSSWSFRVEFSPVPSAVLHIGVDAGTGAVP